jgi:hypothetical protein
MMLDDPSKQTTSGATPTTGEDLQAAKRSAVRRSQFIASAEITDVSSGTLLSARISELGLRGCNVETLNPFCEGTLVHLRILRDQGVFETNAKVVYSHSDFGMSLAFNEMIPNQRLLLEDWLAEFATQLRSAS